jgi:hypothetical protein
LVLIKKAKGESLEEIRNRGPRALRTLDRAVSYQDHIDIALQVVGVAAAEVKYCCGKYVDIYIVPKGRGTATPALVSKVREYFDCRKMIGIIPDVKPAGVTRIWIHATIIAKPFINSTQVEADTLDALDKAYGQGVAKINKRVSLTDIIATLEAVPSIDTAEISEVKVEPFARPINNTSNILNIDYQALPNTNQQFKYKVVYRSGPNNFEIYKAGVFIQQLAIGVNFIDPVTGLTFRINAGVYSNNDTWEFTAFPTYPAIFPTTLIDIDDYSAPVIEISPFIDASTPRTIFSNIVYQTQAPTSNCLPPC